MSETSPAPVFAPYLPPSTATIKVHNTTLFGEPVLWFGHTVFAVLAIVALTFIVFARGPRRKDANLSLVEEDALPVAVTTSSAAEAKQS
ncbi:MAG: hypothetical protein FJY29_05205 [Betaproteobacteria bacterium]|nr:hypothetical protein [Betaproteobacteria bacterium]